MSAGVIVESHAPFAAHQQPSSSLRAIGIIYDNSTTVAEENPL